MKGFKEAYKSIFHNYNEHGSLENSFYISNMYWIHFIPNQSFMNILHCYKLVRLPYHNIFFDFQNFEFRFLLWCNVFGQYFPALSSESALNASVGSIKNALF